MKRYKCLTCILIIAASVLLSFGSVPAKADAPYDDAVFLPDGEGNFYIFINDENKSSLFLVNEASGISEKNCERFAAGNIFISSGSVYLTRTWGHILCLYDVQHKDTVLIDFPAADQDKIAMNDRIICIADKENNEQVRIFKRGGQYSSVLDAGTAVRSVFADGESNNVYAVLSGVIIDVGSGRMTECDIPVFPVYYNDGKYTDSVGDVYTFSSAEGFSLVLSTGSINACTKGGCVYYTEDDVIVRKNIETGDEAIYRPDKKILHIASSGSSVAAMTDRDVFFLHDNEFEAVKEVSDEISQEESVVSVSKETSKEISKETSPKESSKETVKKENSRQETKTKNTKKETSKAETKSEMKPESSEKEISDTKHDTSEAEEVPYDFSEGYVRGIPNGTSVAAFRKSMSGVESVRFRKNDGTIIDKGKIGTDWTIEITDHNVTETYTAVVMGEISGNGEINTSDADMISEYLCELRELSPAQLLAADMNHDGIIDIRDICRFQEVYYTNGKKIPAGAFL